jgi:capsular polysaccharide biosynthesis protein
MLFRYWKRFAVILIVLPVPVSMATLLYFRTFQATTDLWVQDPTYFGSNANVVGSNNVSGWNQYLTPAQNQTDQLDQYLQTTSFLDAIGDNLTTLGVTDEKQRNKLINSIHKNLHVLPNGSHLVTINFSCDHPSYCMVVLSATITVFQDQLTQALKAREQLSTSFLQSQLDPALARYKDSQAALQKYQAAHPGAHVTSSAGPGDPQLDQLATQAQLDLDQVTQLQNQLGQAQFTFAAADRFIQSNTQIVDQPRITAGGLIGDGKSLQRAAVVLVVAVGVAAIYLGLLVWVDKTARDTKELQGRFSIPVLATVPMLAARNRVPAISPKGTS